MSYSDRPDVLPGKTIKCNVGCGVLYLILNVKEDDRYKEHPLNEIWIRPNFKFKDDDDIQMYCSESFLTPLARLLTFSIRRISEEERGDLLKQIYGHTCPKRSVATADSCVDAVARALMCYWKNHRYKKGTNYCYVCKNKQPRR